MYQCNIKFFRKRIDKYHRVQEDQDDTGSNSDSQRRNAATHAAALANNTHHGDYEERMSCSSTFEIASDDDESDNALRRQQPPSRAKRSARASPALAATSQPRRTRSFGAHMLRKITHRRKVQNGIDSELKVNRRR